MMSPVDKRLTYARLVAYCLGKPGAWSDQPWENDTVIKVGSKIFAFLGDTKSASVGLKCGASRDVADEWLHRYPDDASVMPYIGRSGWNTLRFGGAIDDDEILEAVDASYDAVVAKLPKKERPASP
jgi:predicted DNA-binding protein (MmcQ/YjbR family)